MCLSPCSIMNTWAYIGEVPTKACLVQSGRSSGTAPTSIVFISESAYASPDYVATIKRFARQAGFSSTAATQLPFFRRKFKRVNYQARWSTYGMWYAEIGLRSSSLSISEFAEVLTFLFKRKGTALSTVKGYRAMLSAVFKFPFRGSNL